MSDSALQVAEVIVGSMPGTAVRIGPRVPLVVMSGPCVIESEEHALSMARQLSALCKKHALSYIFKSSYDKANRTSKTSFRGLGVSEGCEILSKIRQEINVPVMTDVHSIEEVGVASKYVDLLQIPAFLCRQTDLLVAAGESGKPVMIKKGQFLAPEDMAFAAEKVAAGGAGVMLCERGSCFGYRDLVVDFRSFLTMRRSGFPVIFDGTHSVQSMGGAGGKSGGRREFVPHLLRAAVSFGVDGVFLEVHDEPDRAPSDGPNMLRLSEVDSVFADLKLLSELRLVGRDGVEASSTSASGSYLKGYRSALC